MAIDKRRPEWQNVAPGSRHLKWLWSEFELLDEKEGTLYRKWVSGNGHPPTYKIVIPHVLKKAVFTELHNSPTVGHLGVSKTLNRIKEWFHWLAARKDVMRWCRECDLCANRKPPPSKLRAPLKTYLPGAPMLRSRVAADILGPHTKSKEGNIYILVLADYFTKWIEAYPIPN